MIVQKKCSQCKKLLRLEEFIEDLRYADKCSTQCMDCLGIDKTEYKFNSNNINLQDKRRVETQKSKEVYSIKNLQIKKDKKTKSKTTKISTKRASIKGKSVEQLLDGVVVGTFDTPALAALAINQRPERIRTCLRGDCSTAFSFQWRWKE